LIASVKVYDWKMANIQKILTGVAVNGARMSANAHTSTNIGGTSQ